MPQERYYRSRDVAILVFFLLSAIVVGVGGSVSLVSALQVKDTLRIVYSICLLLNVVFFPWYAWRHWQRIKERRD